MRSRGLMPRDIESLKAIHDKHYKDDFSFPDFINDSYLLKFVVTDDNDNIITGGGVRAITEAVLVTDRDVVIGERRQALLQAMKLSTYAAHTNNFNQLHAFIQGDNWVRHLKKVGFVETKGQTLVYNI